jgi:hypothetical protein
MITLAKLPLFSGAVAGLTTGTLYLSPLATSAFIDTCGAVLTAFCLGALLSHRKKTVVRHLNALPPRIQLKSLDHRQPKASNRYFLESVRLRWAQHTNSKPENKVHAIPYL